MKGKMLEAHPDENSLGHILCWVEIWRPFVQVEALRAHEVRPISEDQASVLCIVKHEDKEPFAYKVTLYSFVD